MNFWLMTALFLASLTAAQAQGPSSSGGTDAEAGSNKPTREKIVPRKTYTEAQKQGFCRKYNQRLIAFYNNVYRVEKCERRPILNNKTVFNLMRRGITISSVPSDVIAAIPEGQPIDVAKTLQMARSCQELEGKYVSFSNVEVYFVQACKKRMIADWATYIQHRSKRGNKTGEIVSLSWIEFASLKDGEPIKSVIDAEYRKLFDDWETADVIPIDEACAGVEGKVVYYYSRVYKIENCRKRSINAHEFLRRQSGKNPKLPPLTSEQWISIPDGRPIVFNKR